MESKSGGVGRLEVLARPSFGGSAVLGGGGTVIDDISVWEVPPAGWSAKEIIGPGPSSV